MALGRFCWVVVLAGGWLGASVTSGFSAKDAAVSTSGLPIPRYVSLKSDHVNVRAGPSTILATPSAMPRPSAKCPPAIRC